MRGSNFALHARTARGTKTTQARLPARPVEGLRLIARKLAERRTRSAVMELSDDQLKDIGLSRGQIESDVHVSGHHWSNKGL
jgi:uncharacterized protein YjiS (DUF1127 family)